MFALLQTDGDGLTVGEIVRDIPHDPAAVFVYVLVLGFVFLIWYGSRRRKPGE